MATATTEAIDRLVARAGQLYSLPAVAMEVLALTGDPKVDAQALKECVEKDPALTAKLLRVVNSSLFGLAREVCDLGQALALLGTKPLKLLVLGFSLPPGLFQGIEAEVLGWYWRHTLTKAVAARTLCEQAGKEGGDEAFIAALLQDVGVLVLIQELGEPYVRFLRKVLQAGHDLERSEQESIGFGHTALTARLLRHWGLPASLVQAVAASGPKGDTEGIPLVETLRLAELVARFLVEERTQLFGQLLRLSTRHGLQRHVLEGLLGELQQKVSELADVLSLQLPSGVDCTELLARAHRQLAQLAEEVTGPLLRSGEGGAEAADGQCGLGQAFRHLADAIRPHGADRGAARRAASGAGRGGAPVGGQADGVRSTRKESTAQRFGALAKAVGACRQSRCPLSVLLVQLEEHDDPFSAHPILFEQFRKRLEAACRGLDHPGLICQPDGSAGLLLILPDCDRQEAVRCGQGLIDQARSWASGPALDAPAWGISVGVATVSLAPKNFAPARLVEAARRCLYGSHASGGGVVKSIEIY